ncbi:MAG: glycoside hydrolase family 92 protein [Lachnospiraceae bacterium]|nr:glycoside hydrolase family 92 protein [Lachnospiraceae bacterium]
MGNSKYYEGNNWNYSFRLLADMEARIELAGGMNAMIALLDEFFGYSREPVQLGDLFLVTSWPDLRAYIDGQHSFEGFNNEPDMETPYNYIFVDRHDRLCEIKRACVKYIFSDGRGGMPGNNDAGGLSACHIWNVLGIFPVAGQNLMLIGSPSVERAKIHLASGSTLEIVTHNNTVENIYVNRVVLNGRNITDYRFTATEMMQGGILEFYMSNEVRSL